METIFALATARAKSALAIIRVSGLDALSISQKICQSQLVHQKPVLCWLFDNTNKPFDHALVTYFRAPQSFTGEDMVEFSVHGSLLIIEKLELILSQFGARHAYAGEFSQRAFINQKIDLTQAEAICDVIDAQNESALNAALHSLKGVFAEKIRSFVNDLIAIRALIEAEIDFIDEDIDFASEKTLHLKIKEIYSLISRDIIEAKNYQKMFMGVSAALIGAPNVGKSSLMNALLQNQRAIVSNEAGTTRDSLIESFNLNGLEIKLIDTAGIRQSDSIAEKISIERTFEASYSADILLIVDDVLKPITNKQAKEMKLFDFTFKKILWIHNKLDLLTENKVKENPIAKKLGASSLFISAMTGEGLDALIKKIKDLNTSHDMNENCYLARSRHIQALQRAKENLKLALTEMEKDIVLIDLLAEQLRFAHNALEEILGVYTSDELLGEIFSHFCIGK